MLQAKSEIRVDDDIVLRRFDHAADDAKYSAIITNHDHLLPWLPWANFYHEPADMTKYTESQIAEFDAGQQFGYDIFYQDKFAGSLDLHGISETNFHADIGYWLDKACTGKGIMTRAVAAITQYAFDELNMHRITISVAPENVASRSVAERLNFTKEAQLKDEQFLIDKFYDTIVYAKIKEA